MFGPHLTLDLYGCEKDSISSDKIIFDILDRLPGEIGMHKISQPQITRYPGRSGTFDSGGISGFVLIAESHISIHTFVSQSYATVDVFSCKEFDTKKATDYLISKFNPQKVEKNLILRGKEFPKDVTTSKSIVKTQRAAFIRKMKV